MSDLKILICILYYVIYIIDSDSLDCFINGSYKAIFVFSLFYMSVLYIFLILKYPTVYLVAKLLSVHV